ncbi:MAG: hypothetical protein ACLQIB_17840 [Isosphaeraceae bacterium]
MSLKRRTDWHWGKLLGISLLIASVVRVPLPLADYHNIRHHDAPGEICVFHDHLLRWHPRAASDDDVALLHWHWFVPLAEPDDPHQPVGDDHRGPVLHAHFSDWPEPDWLDQPVISPDVRGRFAEDLANCLAAADCAYLASQFTPTSSCRDCFSLFPHGAADGVRAGRIALLQRWNC